MSTTPTPLPSLPTLTPLTDKAGKISRVWLDTLQKKLAANADSSSAAAGWTAVTSVIGSIPGVPAVTQVVTLDAGVYKNFQFVLAAGSGATGFLIPTNSTRAAAAGDTFDLYLDEDATGNRDIPVFQGGAGGFASDTQAQIQAVATGTASTRTRCSFKYDGSIWFLTHIPYSGGATT